jgi:hypothetical protein
MQKAERKKHRRGEIERLLLGDKRPRLALCSPAPFATRTFGDNDTPARQKYGLHEPVHKPLVQGRSFCAIFGIVAR